MKTQTLIDTRPDIDTYYLEMCKVVASRSTCTHNKVGAIFVIDNQVISTGYNGAPSGEEHCLDIGCSKPEHATKFETCRAVHAEVNAIIQAALHGVSIKGATLYCTHSPCVMCRRVLKNAKIDTIIFSEEYDKHE
ncbi:MAG: dCMP deaminase family protein [Candidatus Methanomethylophilaceae archaeon]|jgi:dCMP deaminase